MSAAAWLVLRELRARWRRVALAAAVVASLAGAAAAMELLARAREDAVAARVDAMGPALTVVPAGTTAGALARGELDGRALPDDAPARVAAVLGSELRRAEARLVLTRAVAGAPTPVIGAEDASAAGVLVGAELVARIGAAPTLALDGEALPVAGVRPATGGIEDVALTLPLERAARLRGAPGRSNELRLYLRPGVDPRDAERRLGAAGLGAAVIRHDRGPVAASELPGSLARHRGAAYAVLAVAAALCLLIVAHLDATERRVEIATLVAMGAGRASIVGALVGRSVLVAAAGGALGAAAGLALAAASDPGSAGVLLRHASTAVLPVVAAAGLAAIAAAPTALVAALRDPVPALQET